MPNPKLVITWGPPPADIMIENGASTRVEFHATVTDEFENKVTPKRWGGYVNAAAARRFDYNRRKVLPRNGSITVSYEVSCNEQSSFRNPTQVKLRVSAEGYRDGMTPKDEGLYTEAFNY